MRPGRVRHPQGKEPTVTQEETERRAQAQRKLAIKVAAENHGYTFYGLKEAIEYVEGVAAEPYTDDEFEALQ
jgi:hypothetical protein